MLTSSLFSERVAVVGTVDPQLIDDNTADTDWVDMSKFNRAAFVLTVGATDTTVNFKLRSASDGSGTGAADITGKAATQLGATDDNKQVVIEIEASELAAVGASAQFVSARATVGNGTTGAYVAVVALGADARYQSASDYDLASVAEIVS